MLRIRALVLLVGLTAVVTACTDDAEVEAPVLAEAAGEAGSPIADGFEVVPGSVLIGPPLPAGVPYSYLDVDVHDRGWVAVLALEGDPHEVTEAYIEQAVAMGMVRRHGTPAGTTSCRGGRRQHTCEVQARAPEGAGVTVQEDESLRSFTVTAVRSARRRGIDPAVATAEYSAVFLRYSTTHLYWEYGGSRPPRRVRVVPPRPRWAPIPDVGESFGNGWQQQSDLRVAKGSEVAGPISANPQCSIGGDHTVLRVPGDPDEVLAAYAGQLERINGFPTDEPWIDERTRFGRYRQVSTEQAGGDSFHLRLLTPDQGDSWLHITSCAG